MAKTAAEVIVQHLVDEGIRYVFGITGDTVLPLLDALYGRPEIKYVTCRLEHGATGMADGYSRVTGEPGCCLLHVGPGISNAVLGTWIAQRDGVPLIVLSGNMDTFRLGRNLWHEFNVLPVFREVTKWNDQLREAKDAHRIMRTAFQMACSGLPGPVHVDIPKDIAKKPADPGESSDFSLPGGRSAFTSNRSRPDPEAVERACRLLAKAEHPVILAGRGAIWSKAGDDLVELAERLAIPVVTTETGRGAIPEDHPLAFGIAGHFGKSTANEALRRSDVVLGLGCQFLNTNTINWSLIRRDAKVIQVEADPLEIGRQYAVEVGALSDARCFLADSIAFIKEKGLDDRGEKGLELPRIKALAQLREKERATFFGVDLEAVPIKPQRIVRDVTDVIPKDAVIAVGAGTHTQYANHVPIRRPDQYLIAAGTGSMCYGFAAGLGAKLAQPERQVVVLIGDGDFGMMTQELETSLREKIPVTVVVFNDFGYGALRLFQKTYYGGRYIGSDYMNPDFAKLAEAYGARGERIEKPRELRPALERALASNVTTVLDVLINPWEVHYRAPEFKEFHKF